LLVAIHIGAKSLFRSRLRTKSHAVAKATVWSGHLAVASSRTIVRTHARSRAALLTAPRSHHSVEARAGLWAFSGTHAGARTRLRTRLARPDYNVAAAVAARTWHHFQTGLKTNDGARANTRLWTLRWSHLLPKNRTGLRTALLERARSHLRTGFRTTTFTRARTGLRTTLSERARSLARTGFRATAFTTSWTGETGFRATASRASGAKTGLRTVLPLDLAEAGFRTMTFTASGTGLWAGTIVQPRTIVKILLVAGALILIPLRARPLRRTTRPGLLCPSGHGNS
jgi:hypothetical protein